MKRVVTIGPESTGKSTLCSQLAEHYKTTWCPEYAREYLLEKGMDYAYEDLLNIAHGQISLEENFIEKASNEYYFIDTDMYVMKVWCEVAFQNCHTWIMKQIATRKYDLYLLCNPDLPWVKDELREYPDEAFRLRLYKMYKDIVINCGIPWADITGTDNQRLQTAIRVIDTAFTSNKVN
ncbi:MAG: AAA family ATPase [Candidatus Dadabacteria bacterium]